MEHIFYKKEVKSIDVENISTLRPKSLLEAFERIVELARRSKLSNEFFSDASVCIKYASRKLKLSPTQTVFLAIFVDLSDDRGTRLQEISSFVDCNMTKILRLSTEIDGLVEKYYLRASHSRGRLSYRVPNDVLESLKKGQPYTHNVEPITDLLSFFERFYAMMEELNNCEITHEALLLKTKDNLSEIKDSHFASSLSSFNLSDEDLLLFIYMAHLYVENNDDRIVFRDLRCLYDDGRIPNKLKNELSSQKSQLFDCELIQYVNDDGMARPDCFKLSDYAKTDLLSELSLSPKAKTSRDLIKSDSFPEKKLFYNPDEQKQIVRLSTLLSPDRFTDVQNRMLKSGMRPGFCCLFYGAPGTGKTETVYQISRLTGRDILRVDVDKIKSKWVGESEQNIKKAFDTYRKMCKNSPLAPILLFNEADGLLGVRMQGAQQSADKMNNSMQNIILQEMESLEGIMIATTNLTINLDKAFERRFLYKIQFNKPTIEARSSIWQSMMPNLSADDALSLASQFDFSGGEIENITRKYTVDSILDGTDNIDLSEIIELCKNERISKSSKAKVGF